MQSYHLLSALSLRARPAFSSPSVKLCRSFSVVNYDPAPIICVATLVPRGTSMGRIPDLDPLSVAFCCHDDHDSDNYVHNDEEDFYLHCSPESSYWAGGEDVMYRALANLDIRNEAQRVTCQIEEYIGKRNCLQVVTLCERKPGMRTKNSVVLWRSKYGITDASKSAKSKVVHVHALKPVNSIDEGSDDCQTETYEKNCKTLSYEAIQRLLQSQHGRYWLNYAVVIQDIPSPCGSTWIEQTVHRAPMRLFRECFV